MAWTMLDPKPGNGDCVNVAAELRVGCTMGVSELIVVEVTGTVEKDVETVVEDDMD